MHTIKGSWHKVHNQHVTLVATAIIVSICTGSGIFGREGEMVTGNITAKKQCFCSPLNLPLNCIMSVTF